ncbi:hypothetical protein F2P56_008442 [Juglans regia]|uniref:Uncharacterized protein n=1 Tax=Juglans regia TaxID=51240 RepID=A0A834CV78_JUGRE|nr:hypothetical protein F2P56_008442 [Juglans regia]
MHDLLQEMGRELVREESPKEPGKRSRLWFYEDVRHVLEENTGTNKVEGIVVDIPKADDRICLSPKAFVKMKNLRLFINRNARFSGRLNYLPNELRMLDWPECPLQSLPSNFHEKKLVEFRMPSSHIKELGQGFKSSPNLTIMDFSYCESLIKIPDLSRSHSLKKLNLSCCTNLVEIHNSVGFLDKLVSWSLFGCSNLRGLPRSLKLRSLEWLNFYGCSSLTDFPEIECEMKHLRQIGLEYTAIKELPSSIGNLTGLQSLYLKGCKNLIRLPSSILQLQHLESLHLNDCPNLVKNVGDNKQSMASEYETSSNAELLPLLPVSDSSISDDDYSTIAIPFYLESSVLSKSSFFRKSNCLTTLSWLDLSGSDIVSLPESIKGFVGLRRLYVRYCKQLQEIPKLPPNIVEVYASGCKSLESFPEVTRKLQFNICDLQALDFIDLSGCDKMLLSIRNHVANPLLCKGHDYLDGIVFPGNRIPDWFSHRKEILERNSCEIDISGHQCLDEEIRGIALCAIVGPVLSLHPRPIVSARIIGNGILRYIQKQTFNLFASDGAQMGSDHVWLGYSVLESFELKGDNLRVEFFTERSSMFFKSCGAHLVHKHEKSAEDYPSVLREKVDNIEETEISVDLMEGNQLSKRHLDEDDDPNLELNWYPLQKRHCSTLGIKILDLENPQGLKDSQEDLNLELDF